jgi:hypothetical protein
MIELAMAKFMGDRLKYGSKIGIAKSGGATYLISCVDVSEVGVAEGADGNDTVSEDATVVEVSVRFATPP